MGCNSEYQQTTAAEAESVTVAKFITYVNGKLRIEVPLDIAEIANSVYGNAQRLNDLTENLCTKLRSLSEDGLDHIVYDAKSRTSRDLATWWERHQEYDRARESIADTEARRQELVNQAKAKLTVAEQKALGI